MKIKSTKVNSILTKSVVSAGLVMFLGFGMQANAASSCKGLENSACNSKTSCSWVEGYQRKDGKAVKSFCRTKASGKKASSTATNSKKSKK